MICSLSVNGDGKLREVLGVNSSSLIKLKYDDMVDNRVYKWSYNNVSPIECNYIFDASGRLATILHEVAPWKEIVAVYS